MLELLRKKCSLPIYLVEETLSSYAAEEHLKNAGTKKHRRKALLDQAAAVLILETFLEMPEHKRREYNSKKQIEA